MIALLAFAAAGLSATNYAADVPMHAPPVPPTWTEAFAGRRVDPARWRFDTSRNASGWFNHERQYYAAGRPGNVDVSGGRLTITARRETLDRAAVPDWGGQRYTSAKLVSRRAFGPGFYQIRAKLPCARGTWPAIWLLPASGTWPDEGEIDVMEMVGWDPGVVHATLHSGRFNHRLGTQRGAEVRVPTACSAFHDYQLDWRADGITIGIDGHGYMRVANDRPGDTGAWPFARPFHLILNLAVGGDWGGKQGIDDAAFPQSLTIASVRYWDAAGLGHRTRDRR